MVGLVSPRVQALRQIDEWPVEFAAAGVVDSEGRVAHARRGVACRSSRVRVEAGRRPRDARRGRGGRRRPRRAGRASRLDGSSPARARERASVRGHRADRSARAAPHLLERGVPRAREARRGALARCAFAEYVREAVCAPLGIGLDPEGDPGSGMHASLDDVLAIGRELLRASARRRRRRATRWSRSSSRDVSGVLPDYGRFDPLDWGLGVQLNTRPPTWMGSRTSSAAFGHFGGSGTFLWVDPEAQRRLRRAHARASSATWAKQAWPRLSDAVLAELAVAVVGEQRPHELVERRLVAAARRRTGVIAVTVAVRGTCMVSATSPKNSPALRMRRSPSVRLRDRRRRPRGARRSDRRARPRGSSPFPTVTSSRCMRSASFVSVSPGEVGEEPDTRELGHRRRNVPRRHGSTVPAWRSSQDGATAHAARRADGIIGSRVECPACGFVHYANPVACSGGARRRRGRGACFSARRAFEPDAGLWDTIGRLPRGGGGASTALRRELLEETGRRGRGRRLRRRVHRPLRPGRGRPGRAEPRLARRRSSPASRAGGRRHRSSRGSRATRCPRDARARLRVDRGRAFADWARSVL